MIEALRIVQRHRGWVSISVAAIARMLGTSMRRSIRSRRSTT
jgi:NADH:ubiquinone oxidoreductase subunit E